MCVRLSGGVPRLTKLGNIYRPGDRKQRSDELSAEDRTSVYSWWETETTVSSNKRDVKRRRIGVKDHETHATHYLQVSQVNCLSFGLFTSTVRMCQLLAIVNSVQCAILGTGRVYHAHGRSN